MGKKNDLLASFSDSLEETKVKEVEKPPQKEKAVTRAKQGTAASKPVEPVSSKPKGSRGRQKNLALYSEDFEVIEKVQTVIRKATGRHPNESLAVRVALRSTTSDPKKLVAMYQKIRKQDNRFKKSNS